MALFKPFRGTRAALDALEKHDGYAYFCTDDGSLGFKGNVIDCIKNSNIEFDYYYSCGPQVMLKYLAL